MEYLPLKTNDIKIDYSNENNVAAYTAKIVLPYLQKIKINKSNVSYVIPAIFPFT